MTLGSSKSQDSAHLHVTGAARYVDDIPTPSGTLHLAFGLSEIASGHIDSMNLDRVHAAEGVFAVYVAQDLPFANDVSPVVAPEPMLSTGQVHFHGQPLFLVAAKSHQLARKAARLAEVRYVKSPAILTIDDAMKAGSMLEEPQIFSKGDAKGAIHGAAHHISGKIDVGGQEHFYLESQAALALPQEDDEMEIHASTQHPTEIQHKVADALGLSMHAVRVIARRMGGGFGGKESQGNSVAVASAIVASLTKRPSMMRFDRDDDMVITGKRHDLTIEYQVGFDNDGLVKGLVFKQYMRCGWAQDLSLAIADRAMFHADNAYFIPDAHITSYRLRTNTVSNTAFRGFGGPQGMVGIERVMDHIAHYLGQDSLEIRQRNFYLSHDDNAEQTTPYHMKVTDSVIREMVAHLVKSSDYHARRKAVTEWNEQNSLLKKGLALTPVKFGISFTLTQLNQAGALVHLYQDGSVQINHGGTEMGQGLYIKTMQVAADCFGIPLANVRHTATDTSKVPNTSPTAASSGSDLNGMAVKNACETIKQRLIAFLVQRYDGSIEDIVFKENIVQIGQETLPFADVAKAAYSARVGLSASGFYATPKIAWNRAKGEGRPFYYFTYGAAVSEVVLDSLTGENRILRADLILDAGKSLNPAIDIGQLEGGYVQGAGWLTTEELVWDAEGRLRTHAPSTYKIPAMSDRPDIMLSALWHAGENHEETIYRSKAVGEPPLMLGISAFMALSDAAAAVCHHYPNLDAPATAECLLRKVRSA